MPAPDLSNLVKTRLDELLKLVNRTLPVKVGSKVRASIRDNFRKGSFYGGPAWQPPLRLDPNIGLAGPAYGPLLSGSNTLMSSVDYIVGPGRVTLRTVLVYAPIHNDGGEITVTKKMKSYFWAKYHEAGGQSQGNISKEAEFWRNMALKKVGSAIKIPQRQFMGEHPEVDRIVRETIDKELMEFAKKFTNGSTTH